MEEYRTILYLKYGMDKLLTAEAIGQLFRWVVPGFVLMTFIRMFITTRELDVTRDTIWWIIATALYSGITPYFLPIPFKAFNFLADPLFYNFIYPLIIGYFFVLLYRGKYIARFFKYIQLGEYTIEQSAWDVIFSSGKSFYVFIVLKDNTELYGVFSNKSYASNDKACRDFYLEATYVKDAEGQWRPSNQPEGIWIASTEVKYIKLLSASAGEKTHGKK
jgi:hypothetical protein